MIDEKVVDDEKLIILNIVKKQVKDILSRYVNLSEEEFNKSWQRAKELEARYKDIFAKKNKYSLSNIVDKLPDLSIKEIQEFLQNKKNFNSIDEKNLSDIINLLESILIRVKLIVGLYSLDDEYLKNREKYFFIESLYLANVTVESLRLFYIINLKETKPLYQKLALFLGNMDEYATKHWNKNKILIFRELYRDTDNYHKGSNKHYADIRRSNINVKQKIINYLMEIVLYVQFQDQNICNKILVFKKIINILNKERFKSMKSFKKFHAYVKKCLEAIPPKDFQISSDNGLLSRELDIFIIYFDLIQMNNENNKNNYFETPESIFKKICYSENFDCIMKTFILTICGYLRDKVKLVIDLEKEVSKNGEYFTSFRKKSKNKYDTTNTVLWLLKNMTFDFYESDKDESCSNVNSPQFEIDCMTDFSLTVEDINTKVSSKYDESKSNFRAD